MAAEDSGKSDKDQKPPKADMNGANGKADAPGEEAEPKLPPKLKVPAPEKPEDVMAAPTRAMPPPPPPAEPPPRKAETSRIDLAQARADAGEKETTQPIALPGEADVDAKAMTAPIEMPGETDVGPKASTAKIESGETAKIKLPDAIVPAQPVDQTPSERGIFEGPPEDLEEVMKKSTVRIESPIEEASDLKDDVDEAAKKATVRVQIDDDVKKGDTEKVDARAVLEADRADAAKKKTSRIDLGEVLESGEEEDIFKRRTAVLDSSKMPATAAPGAPRTIRIKRPGPTPPTAVLKQPSETAQISKPATTPVPEIRDAKKSETSRIELPQEASEKPPTRRKTIRIKRPDGTTSARQLTIARPSEDVTPGMEAAGAAEEEADSPLASILALVATILVLILFYVLAAQTIAPGLPFPGRLI